MKKSRLWLAVLSAIAIQSSLTSVSALAAPVADEESTSIATRELLSKAELVFSGKVVDVQYKDSVDGIPHTFVTYELDQVIAGRTENKQLTLRFMGGRQQKGEIVRYLDVSETPEFQRGDVDVIFASQNNNHICPLVNCTSGRYRSRDGVLTSDDGRAIIVQADESFAISSVVVAADASEKLDLGRGANAAASVAREPVTSVLPETAVKADAFIAELKTQAKELASARIALPTLVSASVKDEFKAVGMREAAAPADSAPSLLRRINTTSDFDRWEEEAVRKNDGNPVL